MGPIPPVGMPHMMGAAGPMNMPHPGPGPGPGGPVPGPVMPGMSMQQQQQQQHMLQAQQMHMQQMQVRIPFRISVSTHFNRNIEHRTASCIVPLSLTYSCKPFAAVCVFVFVIVTSAFFTFFVLATWINSLQSHSFHFCFLLHIFFSIL